MKHETYNTKNIISKTQMQFQVIKEITDFIFKKIKVGE